MKNFGINDHPVTATELIMCKKARTRQTSRAESLAADLSVAGNTNMIFVLRRSKADAIRFSVIARRLLRNGR